MTVEYDPDELDRAANALGRSHQNLAAEAKALRAAVQSIQRFRGKEADAFRGQIDQRARELDRTAVAIDQQARALRRLAQEVRNLRLR